MLALAYFLFVKAGRQIYRSLNHMAGGLLLVFFLCIGRGFSLLLTSAWLIAFLFAESLRMLGRRERRDGLIDFATKLLSKAARNPLEEKFFAPTFFTLLASLLLVGLLPFLPSLCALLVLSFADPSAALIGIHHGRHKWVYNPQKSLEGSMVMAFVTFFLLFPFVSPLPSAVVAISVTLFESMPLAVSDNLVIPLFTGMLLRAMGCNPA
jgi:glycerol-3-phosphate acyltransferase PlsY